MNSLLHNKSNGRWTWIRTGGKTDFIIADKKYVVQEVTVLNQMHIESDYMMAVKETIKINLSYERYRLTKNFKKRVNAIAGKFR